MKSCAISYYIRKSDLASVQIPLRVEHMTSDLGGLGPNPGLSIFLPPRIRKWPMVISDCDFI